MEATPSTQQVTELYLGSLVYCWASQYIDAQRRSLFFSDRTLYDYHHLNHQIFSHHDHVSLVQ